ncbi:2-octaprenyl-6-methoxyphenyl hydroxylase [Thalassotalea sp. PLHSN55]|uniref:2-octaprenyl-6-methoxyphenyl hydroxylase n=1 Tax=Thalassotalea sp. PLHSN55 TaxID=3435888 RepID=UPI003F846AC9
MTVQHFDIVISGGGLSGALTALSLADLKDNNGKALSIAIIEANPILTDASLTFDDRVLALSHGSAAYLAHVGAWQFLQKHAQPIETIHISDRGHYGKARIDAKTEQVNALGYVVEMALIGQSLLRALEPKTNITWFAPDHISDINWQQEHVNITLASETQLSARLLLGCDGAQSVCRKFANISSSISDYQQVALISNVSTAIAHQSVAYERFTEFGPIAMLPLTDNQCGKNRCSLVWTLPPEQAKQIMATSDEDFKQALEHNFGSWLGSISQVGKRDIYPLKLVQANEQVFHRMVLIGNASHTIHPIAGQGFNLGLRDVAEFAALMKSALENDQDYAQFALLSQYAQSRKQDHQSVIGLTDSLVTLFSNQLMPLVVGRNIGLKVFNYVKPLKSALVKKTMGY